MLKFVVKELSEAETSKIKKFTTSQADEVFEKADKELAPGCSWQIDNKLGTPNTIRVRLKWFQKNGKYKKLYMKSTGYRLPEPTIYLIKKNDAVDETKTK